MELAKIGKKIRAARKEQGLTQARLAEMAGISRGTLNGLETGMVMELGFHKIQTILKILGYDLSPAAAPPKDRTAQDFMRKMARRYIWWQSPEESIKDPHRLIAQIMDMGTLEDIRKLAAIHGKRRMAEVLTLARPGWFQPKSWAFWNIALDQAKHGSIPPIPARKLDVLLDPT